MSALLKMLDPLLKPAARLYQAQLAKDLNKMGKFIIFDGDKKNMDNRRHTLLVSSLTMNADGVHSTNPNREFFRGFSGIKKCSY